MKRILAILLFIVALIPAYSCKLPLNSKPEPTITPVPLPFIVREYAVNCKGGQYTDHDGNVWSADRVFDGTFGVLADLNSYYYAGDIPNTLDDALYISGRFSTQSDNVKYRFALASGTYIVLLKFVSISSNSSQTIAMEGADIPSLTNHYVHNLAGGEFKAYDDTAEVNVIDGYLDIEFKRITGSPSIAAIMVGLIATPTATVTFTPTMATPTITPTYTATPDCAFIFGNNADDNDIWVAGLAGIPYTASSAMTVNAIWVKSTENGDFCTGIYSDNSGEPGTLLNQSPITAAVAGWNMSMIPNTALSAGSVYWIVVADNFTFYLPARYDLSAGSSCKTIIYSWSSVVSAGMPSNLVSWSSAAYIDPNIFAAHCAP